jgi:osmotically-inducible protein OsmY
MQFPADYDQRLAAAIRQTLEQQTELNTSNIRVEVVDGTVLLGGDAQTPAQIALAMRLTQNTPGVAAVSNDIVLRQP